MRRALAKLCGVSLVGVMAGSIVAACSGSNGSSTKGSSTQVTGSATGGSSGAPTTTSRALKTSFGDGTWVVGRDIAPGTYSTQDAGICSYNTTNPSGGGQQGQQSNTGTPGQVTVTIDSNVTAFTTHGCGTWVKQ